MPDFIILMYSDVHDRGQADDGRLWQAYLAKLRSAGGFKGGSSIGEGLRMKKMQPAVTSDRKIEGFIRITAESLEAAQRFVDGNPNYEAGGTVDIRELPADE